MDNSRFKFRVWNIANKNFIYDEDTPKLNIAFDNFEINEDQ